MNYKNKVQKQNLTPLFIIGVLAVVAVIVMAVVLALPGKPQTGEFVPPAFDGAAVQGTSDVPDGLGYSSPYQEGMAYRFSVCGNVKTDGNIATVICCLQTS